MNKERFELLVGEAIETLPEDLRQRMENVDVVVEDAPAQSQLRRSGLGKNMTLLGLYEGIPLTERNSNYGLVTPDKITIFQKTIERSSPSQDESIVKEKIREVVIHEIAHHFGISDSRLKQIERERKKSK